MSAALTFALISLQDQAAATTEILDHYAASSSAAKDIAYYSRSADDDSAYVVLARSPEEYKQSFAAYRSDVAKAASAFKASRKYAVTDAQNKALDDFERFWSAPDGYLAQAEVAFKLKRAGKLREAQSAFSDSPTSSIDATVKRYRDECTALERAAQARSAHLARQAIVIGVLLGVAAIIIAVVIATVVGGAVGSAVSGTAEALMQIVREDFVRLSAALSALAAGDLTVNFSSQRNAITIRSRDEVGRLTGAYNDLAGGLNAVGGEFENALARLRNLAGGAAQSSSKLASASAEVASATTQGNVAVAQISTSIEHVATVVREQADTLRSSSVAVEELSRSASQIASGAADQANAVHAAVQAVARLDTSIAATASLAQALDISADQASGVAASGAGAVEETAGAMRRIRDESHRAATVVDSLAQRSRAVGEVVSVIDEIADQTNLLALNAAIEAARAGEHGRGFSVVADEVRKLAERAAGSTREIGQILTAIQRETAQAAEAMIASTASTTDGLQLAERATGALKTLLSATHETTRVAKEMTQHAVSMREASDGVTSNVSSVSAVIEQNAQAAAEMSRTTNDVSGTIGGIAMSADEQSARHRGDLGRNGRAGGPNSSARRLSGRFPRARGRPQRSGRRVPRRCGRSAPLTRHRCNRGAAPRALGKLKRLTRNTPYHRPMARRDVLSVDDCVDIEHEIRGALAAHVCLACLGINRDRIDGPVVDVLVDLLRNRRPRIGLARYLDNDVRGDRPKTVVGMVSLNARTCNPRCVGTDNAAVGSLEAGRGIIGFPAGSLCKCVELRKRFAAFCAAGGRRRTHKKRTIVCTFKSPSRIRIRNSNKVIVGYHRRQTADDCRHRKNP